MYKANCFNAFNKINYRLKQTKNNQNTPVN